MPDLMHDEMKRALSDLVQDIAGWGVMIQLQYPGDVPFLAPIAPRLRGLEIVAVPKPQGTSYDLWRDEDMVRSNLTRTDVAELLRAHTPQDDEELKSVVAQWVEDTFDHFGIQRIDTHSG